ncbi:hypothetical protein [Flavobacterium sp. 3HN19-14]|uniref:hypothetical protein n=1 Tax=Flavobacterium sp. 3HN19-14 TaxID=3448133 RepID=UPI003EDEE57A
MNKEEEAKRAHKDLRKLQIGQVFDGTLNKVKQTYCLNMKKLMKDKMVLFSNDEVLEYYAFSDYSGDSTDHSIFDIGGGAKGGEPMVNVAAAYNYYNEKAKMIRENKLTAEIYKVKKVSIWLVNLDDNAKDFIDYIEERTAIKRDYARIQRTENKDLKLLRIQQFKMKWGTGLITKLNLMGGAMAEIEFSSSSTDSKSNSIHEAELSIGSRFASAEGKMKLDTTLSNANLSVNMKGTVVSFPKEVKSFSDYVDAQVSYLKKYLESKTLAAAAPKFQDSGDHKPIKVKDIELLAPKEETLAEVGSRIKDRIKNSISHSMILSLKMQLRQLR